MSASRISRSQPGACPLTASNMWSTTQCMLGTTRQGHLFIQALSGSSRLECEAVVTSAPTVTDFSPVNWNQQDKRFQPFPQFPRRTRCRPYPFNRVLDA